jgi:hypothetical protein
VRRGTMQRKPIVESRPDGGAAAGGCGCIPDPERQEGVGVISGCVCQGVERVVHDTRTRRVGDVVKVIAFAALLVGLVVGLAFLL